MVKVLFVCLGNICRSPTADGVFGDLVVQEQHPDIQVDSCGTAGYHIGGEPDKRSQQTALKNGIDLSQLRARQLRHTDFAEFDYILAMDKENLRNMMAICPQELQSKVHLFMSFSGNYPNVTEVPDPYYGGANRFDE
ncbi:MAG: low molecular weight phosphotyrosine protein phosphatase, partial [Emcibacteraceae bacterium]|nr:low molecular weight phosphotyrosine protein phosphatase [Emcibacteraceae bacterium]